MPQKGCGTLSQTGSSANSFHRALDVGREVYLENTIIIQHDPDFQEVGDMARRLRCVWGAQALQKSVNAKLPEVYQPSLVSLVISILLFLNSRPG